jgi:hypothetical protein
MNPTNPRKAAQAQLGIIKGASATADRKADIPLKLA